MGESTHETTQSLFKAALEARERSHSPYSGCKVGAAVRTTSGDVYSGCNVENSSYPGSICAEQTAIVKAVSSGHRVIEEVLVVTDANPPWPPCGICRQVIAEFASPDTLVHLADVNGPVRTFRFGELLPHAFTADHMPNPDAK